MQTTALGDDGVQTVRLGSTRLVGVLHVEEFYEAWSVMAELG